jgi:hypothetical protein
METEYSGVLQSPPMFAHGRAHKNHRGLVEPDLLGFVREIAHNYSAFTVGRVFDRLPWASLREKSG